MAHFNGLRERLLWKLPKISVKTVTNETPLKAPFSIIATSLNEERGIVDWLNRMVRQTISPSEVIICDGGSTDKTIELSKEWITQHASFPLKIIPEKGVNIAKGRNIAAQASSSDYLLFSDLGSLPEDTWAEELMKGFSLGGEFIMGVSKVESGPAISLELARLVLNQNPEPELYLPSARTMAIKRSAFIEIGGFPEKLSFAGEDTLFAVNARKRFATVFSPKAVVSWGAPSTYVGWWRTLYRYAKGDGESGLFYSDYLGRISELIALIVSFALSLYFIWRFILFQELISGFLSIIALIMGMQVLKGYSSNDKRWSIIKAAAALILISSQAVGFVTGVISNNKKLDLSRISS